jgi:hypothetical protein
MGLKCRTRSGPTEAHKYPGTNSCHLRARLGTRTFTSFTDAVNEIANARVFGGIHFRVSCVRGNTPGTTVADYILRHAMRERGHDRDDGEN